MDSTTSNTSELPGSERADLAAGRIVDVLGRLHPQMWQAILLRASKQADIFPDGMDNAAEPAYRYVPGEA